MGTRAKQDKVRTGCGDKGPANIRPAPNGSPAAQQKPTRALPSRPGRNIHPAGLPKPRRSKEQVEADCKAALKASEEQAHNAEMAKDLLARMNILEDDEEEDLPVRYPQRLSARIDKRYHAGIETESDECFDIRVDEEDSDLDSPPESDKTTEAKPKVSVPYLPDQVSTVTYTASQRTKRVRGAAHQELLSRTKALRAAERNDRKKLNLQITDARLVLIRTNSVPSSQRYVPYQVLAYLRLSQKKTSRR